MTNTDFRNNKPPELEFTYKGELYKFWLLTEGQVSTDRVLSAQQLIEQAKNYGSSDIGMLDYLNAIILETERQPMTPDGILKIRELCHSQKLLLEDAIHYKDRISTYTRIGSLFTVMESEPVIHPLDGAYTDQITELKFQLSREVPELNAFFLSVGMEFMKILYPTLPPVSMKTLVNNQRKYMKIASSKVRNLRRLGISNSFNY